MEVITGKGPATLYKKECIEASKNVAELTAVLKAVERIKEPCYLTIYTDSEYVAAGFEQGWIETWEENDWLTAKGKQVANKELWQGLKARIGDSVIFQIGQDHSYKAWMELELKGGNEDV